MKTLKYLIAALAVVFALAGCASSSGGAMFDYTDTSGGPLHINPDATSDGGGGGSGGGM